MNTYRSVPFAGTLHRNTFCSERRKGGSTTCQVHGKQKRDGQLHSTHSTVQFTHLPHLGESRRFRFDRFAFPGVGQTAFTSSTRRRLSFSSPPRHSPPAAGLLREVNPTRETLSLSLSRSYFDWLGCPRGVRRYAAEERFFDSLVASGFALPRSSPWHLILFPSPRTSGFPPVDNATDRPSCGQRRLCCLSLYASLPPQAGPRWSVVR